LTFVSVRVELGCMSLFGTSGIRAVFNRELVHLAFRVGLAVGKTYPNTIIATDTRTSGDAMKHAVMAGLLSAGVDCWDAGIAPTPTLAYAARFFNAGVMITASHNPPEYNGIKLINPDGSSFTIEQQKQIEQEIASDEQESSSWEGIKQSSIYRTAIEKHIDFIASRFPDKLKIMVVIDAGGGAASEVTPGMFQRLGAEVISINCQPTGFFPRGIEPIAKNLAELCDKVKETGADLGIAHDGDADRMMAVDDRGRFVPGDSLLAVFTRVLGVKDLVTTLDASMVIEEIGAKVRRTRIGDTAVSEELKNGGEFGGETSGSWIFPEVSLCPDGIYAAVQLAVIVSGQKLSELVDSLPAYSLRRGSIGNDGIDISGLESGLLVLNPKSVSNTDGIKLDFTDGWLLVRSSGTEPKIRITAEARSEERVTELYDKCLQIIKESAFSGRGSN
jgi:phosphoglucosamine mutase